MINLMYVVLMALLAMNVSTEVLNGFSIVEDGLARSTKNAVKENNSIYLDFDEQMKANPEARIPQKALAEEITLLVHGEAGLKTAQGATQTLFGGSIEGKTADELETIFKDVKSAEVAKSECVGQSVFMIAAKAGMFKSNGEARRMAQQGGLSLNGAKVDDKRVFEEGDLVGGRVAVLRSGKKNHFLLKVSQS